ncbi:MAG TPA: pyridoxamine 5'-phosphate oxidase family protein [Clostridia bacterium]
MSNYENAMKILDELCGNDKEELIALATVASSPNAEGNPRPAVRMICAYYENGVFYASTNAKSKKMLQIEKNNEVAIAGQGWYTFHGEAENLGWVKDEKNAAIRAKFKKIFGWFDEDGDEDNPDSIVLRITLTEGVIIDHSKKYGKGYYKIDFVNKTVE